MLTFHQLQPAEPLRPFVRRLWFLRGDGRGAGWDALYPDGRPEIVFHLGDAFARRDGAGGRGQLQPGAILVGPVLHTTAVRPTGHADVVGITLHPWALRAVAGADAGAVGTRIVPLAEAAERPLRDLGRELPLDGDPTARAVIIQRRLLGLLRASHREQARCERLARWDETARSDRVGELGESLGVTRRQVHRIFRAAAGLSPKAWLRLRRFQRALRLSRESSLGWAAIAASVGYTDQAHLVREVRAFTGGRPSSLRSPGGAMTEGILAVP